MPYLNFFQPTMKLVEKMRIGSKVKKKYDVPKTPYQRVLESPSIKEEVKERLRKKYDTLNPVELKRKIEALQRNLFDLQILKKAPKQKEKVEVLV